MAKSSMSIKYLLTVFLLCFCTMLLSQNIIVLDFKPLPDDMSAILEGTMKYDQNGEKCAIIKIETTQTGFIFDVGTLGVVDQVQKPGEVWLYVPEGVKRISISHAQLGVLRNHDLGMSVQKGKTYLLRLSTGKVRTVIEEDDGMGYFALQVTPANSSVLVDGEAQVVDSEGNLMIRIKKGEHSFTVSAPGYYTKSDRFILNDGRLATSVTLESKQASVVVDCPTSNAEIYINDAYKGKKSWRGTLTPGSYLFEARLAGYESQKVTVSLAEKEKKNITIPELIPITGSLDVSYTPINSVVTLDGKELGQSPNVFKNIIIGNHVVSISKDGYKSQTQNIKIEKGVTYSLKGSLEKIAEEKPKEITRFLADTDVRQIETSESEDNTIYTVVEEAPEFPGGLNALMEFISKNLKYPSFAAENGIQGRVMVSFVVEKDGSVSDIQEMRSPSEDLTKEAKRIVSSMPKWKPGKLRGKPVRVKFLLPVTFRLQ